jgi:hypothetical protein
VLRGKLAHAGQVATSESKADIAGLHCWTERQVRHIPLGQPDPRDGLANFDPMLELLNLAHSTGIFRMARKLATIVAADVAGYSRLMECDEQATFSALKKQCAVQTSHIAFIRQKGQLFTRHNNG